MKKFLWSITLTASALFSVSAHAAVASCEAPSDGDWSGYCSCFIEQAVNACESCDAIHAICTESWVETSLHHASTSMISTQCTSQIAEDDNANCVAPGTTQDTCELAVSDYKAHCI